MNMRFRRSEVENNPNNDNEIITEREIEILREMEILYEEEEINQEVYNSDFNRYTTEEQNIDLNLLDHNIMIDRSRSRSQSRVRNREINRNEAGNLLLILLLS